MSIPQGGGYPPGPPHGVPGPPGSGWNYPGSPPPPGGPVPPGGPGGPPGGWPPHGYPQGPPPPPGRGNRTGVIIGVIALVVVVIGGVVAGVLLTQDDDKGKTSGPTGSPTSETTTTKPPTTRPPTSDEPSEPPTTRPATTPPTRPPTSSAPRGSVLANLNVDDCINSVAGNSIVVDPILPVACTSANSHWKVVAMFPSADPTACDKLPPEDGYVGQIKEFSSAGRMACLGFTRNTTLQDLKNLAGSAVANLTEADFSALVQSYKDKGVVIE